MNSDAVHESAMAGDVDGLAAALSAAARLGEGSVLTELNSHGWSPLHCASIAGDKQAVDMLLTAGAKINAKSSQAEETPLHFAAAWDHREVVNTLLSRGAFLEETNHAGSTALHKACEYGAENAVAELLQRGVITLYVEHRRFRPRFNFQVEQGDIENISVEFAQQGVAEPVKKGWQIANRH